MAATEDGRTRVEQPKLERINTVARRPLYEEALSAIRTAILRGSFAPGERLYGPDLARDLGLSRGPVREALHKLEQEGIVVSSPHHGSSVVTIDDDEIRDAVALREYLETLHCDRVTAGMTDEILTELEDQVGRMSAAAQADDLAGLAENDFAFHDRLISIGRSPLLHRVWRSIAGQLQMSLAVSDPVFLKENGDIAREHEPILAALRARDPEQLEVALREHLSNVTPLLQQAGRRDARDA